METGLRVFPDRPINRLLSKGKSLFNEQLKRRDSQKPGPSARAAVMEGVNPAEHGLPAKGGKPLPLPRGQERAKKGESLA